MLTICNYKMLLTGGMLSLIGSPQPHLSETRGWIRTLGPALGEHNSKVLGGLLGLREDQMQALLAKGSYRT